jgi:hypothetical protein
MSVVFSGNFAGSFLSDGTNQFINLPSGYDAIMVRNFTKIAAGSANGIEYFWQRGMTNGRGLIYSNAGGMTVGQIAANAGFWYWTPADQDLGASFAISTVSGATPPLVTTTSGTAVTAAGLNTGDVVRLYNMTGARQLGGMDFTITFSAANAFELTNMQPIVAGTTGSFRKVNYNPLFYPRTRYITNISQATQAIVTLSVTHDLTVGQKIRFVVPSIAGSATYYGMTEIDGLAGTIVAVGTADADGYTNTLTVDIDTSAFTAFSFPLTATAAAASYTFAHIVPFGENTAQANTSLVNPFAGARDNTSQIGVLLIAGANSPAGLTGDTIYWQAWKAF